MWVKKYAPENIGQLVGNPKTKKEFFLWLEKWKPGKAALLYGPPGIGKTTIAYLAAKKLGYDIVEMNASDLRNKAGIASVLGAAATQASLFSRGKLLLADEVDGVAGRRDRGAIGEIVSTVKKSSFPLVLTANRVKISEGSSYEKYVSRWNIKGKPNKFAIFQFLKKAAAEEGKSPSDKWIWRIVYTNLKELESNERAGIRSCLKQLLGGGDWWSWDSKLSPLKEVCHLFRFEKPSVSEIVTHLERICKAEGVSASRQALETIASKSGGDVRAAVNSLQSLALEHKRLPDSFELDERDERKNLSDALRIIFKTKDFSIAKAAINKLHVEPRELGNWLGHNMPREYSKGDLASGFDQLSKADLFAGRIFRRQDWKLMKYQLELMAGVAMAKEAKSSFSGSYSSPLERFVGTSRKKRRLRKQVAAKLSPILHVSRRTAARNYLWLLPLLLEKDKSLGEALRLDDEELQFLGVAAAKGKAKRRAKRSPKTAKKRRRRKAS